MKVLNVVIDYIWLMFCKVDCVSDCWVNFDLFVVMGLKKVYDKASRFVIVFVGREDNEYGVLSVCK